MFESLKTVVDESKFTEEEKGICTGIDIVLDRLESHFDFVVSEISTGACETIDNMIEDLSKAFLDGIRGCIESTKDEFKVYFEEQHFLEEDEKV